jgi:hypothetical protein
LEGENDYIDMDEINVDGDLQNIKIPTIDLFAQTDDEGSKSKPSLYVP